MPPFTPICPKCGYDQSGEIATWSTQCPIEGTCPECGYKLHWPDVVNPARIHLPWFVEHAKSKRQLLRRTLPTMWMLLIPNRYWRRVTMETPRSMKNYFVFIAFLMIVLHFVSAFALAGARFGYTRYENAYYSSQLTIVPASMKQNYASAITDTTTTDYWIPIAGEALLYPIINRSFYYDEEFAEVMSMIATGFLGLSIMWAILYCAFPVTRKRTKLRMIHIARAMIVAGCIPLLMIEFGRILDAAYLVSIYWTPLTQAIYVIFICIFGIVIGTAIWIQWFWITATRIGWKVKAKWWELILVAIASLLGAPIAGALMLAFEPVRIAIDHFAAWIGI